MEGKSIGQKAVLLLLLWIVSAAVIGALSEHLSTGRIRNLPIVLASVGAGWLAYRIIHEDDPDGISDHLGMVGYMLAITLSGLAAWHYLVQG
jgi:hypothetical protein